MLHLIISEERYLLTEQVSKFRTEALARQADTMILELTGAELSPEVLRPHLTNLSFFATRKLIIIDQLMAFWRKADRAHYQEMLLKIDQDTDVLLIEEKLDGRDEAAKNIRRSAQVKELSPLKPAQAISWLQAEAQRRGGEIMSQAAYALVDACSSNLLLLSHELDKLIAYTDGNAITKDDVVLVSPPIPEENLFGFLDAYVAGNSAKAMHLLQQQYLLKVSPVRLLSNLATQVEKLIYIALADLERNNGDDNMRFYLGNQLWKLKDFRPQSRRLPIHEWLGLYRQIARAERDIKNGRINDDLAVELILLRQYPDANEEGAMA